MQGAYITQRQTLFSILLLLMPYGVLRVYNVVLRMPRSYVLSPRNQRGTAKVNYIGSGMWSYREKEKRMLLCLIPTSRVSTWVMLRSRFSFQDFYSSINAESQERIIWLISDGISVLSGTALARKPCMFHSTSPGLSEFMQLLLRGASMCLDWVHTQYLGTSWWAGSL